MCIRDSTFTTFTKKLVGVYYTQLINFGKLTIPFLLSTVLGCLLYTSDAADERSSVDLGGRRIIKKKNTYELLRILIE